MGVRGEREERMVVLTRRAVAGAEAGDGLGAETTQARTHPHITSTRLPLDMMATIFCAYDAAKCSIVAGAPCQSAVLLRFHCRWVNSW